MATGQGLRDLRTLACSSAVAVLSLAVSCAPEPVSNSHRKPVIPVVDSPNRPYAYELADPSCQDSDEITPLSETLIRAWDGAAPEDRTVKLPGFQSDSTSLITHAIRETTWGDVYERLCDLERTPGHYCETKDGRELGWSLTESKGGLRVCKDGNSYGRESYEGVALTSAHFIQRASDRFVTLSGKDAPPQIRLAVMPEFIDYYDHYKTDGGDKRLKTWITHNLAYFPYGELIAVFPETEKDQAKLKGFFWESSFVLAHEYGHHVDYSLHESKLAALGLVWDPIAHVTVDQEALRLGLAGDSARAQMEGAVSEAFADLHAWYVEGGIPNSLIGIPELGVDRNIASETFGNGADKILTSEAYAAFMTPKADGDSTSSPDFRDIHIVGAVFALTANEVFARVARGETPAGEGDATALTPDNTDGQASDAELAKRYGMLLSWLDGMYTGIGALKLTDDNAVNEAALAPFGSAIQAATDDALTRFPLTGGDAAADQVRADVCRIVAKRLPALAAAPFATTDGSCAP